MLNFTSLFNVTIKAWFSLSQSPKLSYLYYLFKSFIRLQNNQFPMALSFVIMTFHPCT